MNSKIFPDTTDMSQTHNGINGYISADDLVNSESYKNPTSPDPNGTSVSSRSEKAATKNAKLSKRGGELDNVTRQVLVIDDDLDSAIAIRTCLESYLKKERDAQGSESQVMEVTMYSDPVTALVEFKPYYYDLVLVDINMPTV
ncbi:MAG: hypothetical protein WBX01_12275, partial [Nitrososphaeraceae archaeon]